MNRLLYFFLLTPTLSIRRGSKKPSPDGEGWGEEIQKKNSNQTGFSYIEVLAASFILAVCITPALEALYSGVQGSSIAEITTIDLFLLNGKMEEMLSTPFSELSTSAATSGPATPSSYSDVITTTDNRQLSRLVYLSKYDGDNADGDNDGFTGTDDNLVWIKVKLDGTAYSVESLVSKYK